MGTNWVSSRDGVSEFAGSPRQAEAKRRSLFSRIIGAALLISVSACGQFDELTGAGGAVASSSQAAEGPCGWDPEFGNQYCVQGDWWLEFSVRDTSTAALEVEISGTPNRTVALRTRINLGDGSMKFTGGPGSPVRAGTLIRLKATQTATGRTATSAWFPYRVELPAVACQACTPVCAPGSCGSDGCGGACGPCAAGTSCTGGLCVACTPSCAPGSCGSDGCGGSCGTCAAGTSCVGDRCVCTPTCGSNQCGSDGCGGTCGTCAGGSACQAGQCVAGGCVAPWDPTWKYGDSAGDWWGEFEVAGGGVLTRAVWVEVVGRATISPLTYGWGRWAGSVSNLVAGTLIIVHARDALGATSQTLPFRYRVDTALSTDQCRGKARTSTSCQPLARGLVTFTIDDSGESQASVAVPLLRQYGVKATFYHVPPFLTWTSLARSLALEGHETGAHTMTHRSLTGLSAQEVDDELRLSKQALEANVSSPVESFATPSGAYNASVVAAIKPHFRSHRTTVPGMNYVGSDVYELSTDFVLNTSTPAGVCAQMAEAAALRGWLVLTFHDFTTASTASQGFTVTAANFEAMLACARNTPGLDVVTTRQGVAAISCAAGAVGGGTGGGTGGGAGGGTGG